LSTAKRLKIDGTDGTFGDWRDDLIRDGYAVVKGAIPRERALGYADRMYSYLESFGTGYNRNDPSTVHPDKLPVINEKGMLMHYGAPHEDFVWDIRSEPGMVDAFAKVYATEDLIVSFDAINYGFWNRANLPANKPWPHQDQDPEKPGFRCLQGLVNLLPNGPNDGGLIVCKGAHLLSEQFHEEMKHEERIPAWTPEWYGFTDAGMAWLKDHGCEWVKVEAEPGDLLLWDSRTPHYNVPQTGKQDRLAVYTCYMPVADASQEDLIRKKAAWDGKSLSTPM
jgi:ectoine hydroxylase-related dioxygenase (phytanoyl-CoA dioxygenase family)